MGCGCSGRGSKQISAVKGLMASAKPSTPGVEWKVTFPNGSTKTFVAEWQAHHAVSLAGGKVTRVTKGPARNQAVEQTAKNNPARTRRAGG